MNNKSNTLNPVKQLLPAGVAPNDHNIEFIGNISNKTVIWTRCGNSHEFKNLPQEIYNALEELFFTDQTAIGLLTKFYPESADNVSRLVEIYTYYMYGQCDSTPDVINGELQPCENLRDHADCISRGFDNKFFDINGVHLTPRDLKIIDLAVAGEPDKAIAGELGIHIRTFDFHKRRLFDKIAAQSKIDLVRESLLNQVSCAV